MPGVSLDQVTSKVYVCTTSYTDSSSDFDTLYTSSYKSLLYLAINISDRPKRIHRSDRRDRDIGCRVSIAVSH